MLLRPDINCVRNAVAIPVLSVTYESLKFGIYDADGSLCVPALHRRETGASCQFGDFPSEVDTNTLATLPPGIYGGLFFDHFGHFITESIGRLWAACAPEVDAALPIYVFEPWNKIDLENEGYFAVQTLRFLGVDTRRIVKIERPAIISELLVPQQKYGWHLLSSPPEDFRHFLRRAQSRIECEAQDSGDFPGRVYVSRSLLDPSHGKVAGEGAFERFLTELGYYIFHPQEHPLSRQLQIYNNAEKLIFCEGSAVHACILLPHLRAKVAVIARRAASGVAAQFHGFNKKASLIQCLESERSFGLPKWCGVATIDYLKCSRLLCEEGFICVPFDEWRAIAETQEREALAAYVRTIVEDRRFLHFLMQAGLEVEDARLAAAQTRAAAAEAELTAVRSSTSWRIAAPLRWAKWLLTRDHRANRR